MSGLGLSLRLNPSIARRQPPSASAFPASIPIVPASGAGVTSVLQGDGSYLVTKTGATGWNTTSSVILGDANGDLNGEILTGDFVIACEVLNPAHFAQVGMDATVNGNHDNTTITVAMLLNGGSLYDVREGGTLSQGPHAYGGATVFFMRRIGSTVTFLKGNSHDIGAATLVFTGTGSFPPTHYFATSFYDSGSQWKLRVYNL